MGDRHTPELLPGTLYMLILGALAAGPLHGYAIVKRVKEASREGLSIEDGSLYAALNRMLVRTFFLPGDWIRNGWPRIMERAVRSITYPRKRCSGHPGLKSGFCCRILRSEPLVSCSRLTVPRSRRLQVLCIAQLGILCALGACVLLQGGKAQAADEPSILKAQGLIIQDAKGHASVNS
jgi:PadR family transcriptional regulator